MHITIVGKIVDNQQIQVALIDSTLNDFDSTLVAKATPKFSGFPLTVTTILATDSNAEEKVCYQCMTL